MIDKFHKNNYRYRSVLISDHLISVSVTLQYSPLVCRHLTGWVANSEDPDEMPHFSASHLGLHCLLRTVWPNTYSKVQHVVRVIVNQDQIFSDSAVLKLALYEWAGHPSCPLLPPLCPSWAAPLSNFNSRHKTLHLGESFMKIGPKLKKLSVFKGQFYMYSIFEVFIVEWIYIL